MYPLSFGSLLCLYKGLWLHQTPSELEWIELESILYKSNFVSNHFNLSQSTWNRINRTKPKLIKNTPRVDLGRLVQWERNMAPHPCPTGAKPDGDPNSRDQCAPCRKNLINTPYPSCIQSAYDTLPYVSLVQFAYDNLSC
jgi:hypothetical protein